MPDPGILHDIRVLECASGIAAPLAAMHLAEAGADVVKIEPPGGDPTRAQPGFAVWNRSKRSALLALDDAADAAAFDRLLASADVLIHDLPAARARARGWDAATLAARQPGLIVCGVPPYPVGHVDEDRVGNDTLVFARLGLMDEQRGHRPGPIFLRMPFASFGAAWLAACGVVARLIARDGTGRAGAAGTSLLQGALVPMTMHWARAESPDDAFAMGLPKDAVPSLFECEDGVWLHLMRPPENGALMRRELEGMGEDRVAELRASAGAVGLAPNYGANVEAFRHHPSATWLEDLWAHDVPVQAAVPLGEIYFDEQAGANDYVVEVEDPLLGKTRQPGHPYTTVPPARIAGPAPALGEHTEAVLAEDRVRPSFEPSGSAKAPPLAGLRVLDFGNFLAGPMAPMLLADLGADVVKVEATTGDQMRYVARVFEGCQRGKRGVALDLKDERARSVLERLVAGADVVHHNLRMPAATRLGLDYDTLSAIRPDLVYCHVSSYGPRGPRADWPGFDQLFQAQAGWEIAGAGLGNPPMWHRFGMMDHQCALASLFATLLGVRERGRTGKGQFASSSLLGASILTVSETVVFPDGCLAPFDRLDSAQTGVSERHRIYECRDGWVAVVAEDAGALRMGLGLVAGDEIQPAFAALDAETALGVLADAGIPSEPVRLDQREAFLGDARNREIGLAVRYPHAAYGWIEQIGGLWQMGELRLPIERSAPGLGQHTREILTEAGLAEADVEVLIGAGVVVATD